MGDLSHMYYMGTDSNSTQKSKDWALKKKYIIFILLHNILMARKTTELSVGTSAQELGLRLKSLNFHEVEYNQVSSLPEYIKDDKSNFVFKAVENSSDSSSWRDTLSWEYTQFRPVQS